MPDETCICGVSYCQVLNHLDELLSRHTPPRLHPSSPAPLSTVPIDATSSIGNRRSLKRSTSNMSDVELSSMPYLQPRRRLRMKQTPPLAYMAARASDSAIVGLTAEPPNMIPLPLKATSEHGEFWQLYEEVGIHNLNQRDFDRNKIRTLFRAGFLVHHRDYCESLLNSKRCPSRIKNSGKGHGWKLSSCADALLKELSTSQRFALCKKILLQCDTPAKQDSRLDLLSWMYKQDFRAACTRSDVSRRWLHCQNALLTWNGDFGVIDNSNLQGLLKNPELLVTVLSKRPDVKDICTELELFARSILKNYHLAHVSCSIELCTKTLEDDGDIRLHCHMMLEHKYGQKLSLYTPEPFMFRGSLPNKSIASLMSSIGTSSCTKASAGHYYLLMPKVGKLWAWGTCRPFVDFRINPDHVMAFVQSGRMHSKDAVGQLLQTYKDAEKHVRSLEYCKMKLSEQLKEQKIAARCKLLARNRHPRRRIAIVDDVFLPHMNLMVDRHSFLVLDGPSQVGKTTFCKQLCTKADGYVEIDCTGLTVAPNLHVLSDSTELICFDECEPWYVAKYRKLFQGPEKAVNLGDTQSSRFSYSADLWGIKMVICSNNWAGKLALLPDPTDREYIAKNSFYHYCNEPLWVDPSEPVQSTSAATPPQLPVQRGICHTQPQPRQYNVQ